MNCKTCRYWDNQNNAELWNPPTTYGACRRIPLVDIGRMQRPSEPALVPVDFDHIPLTTHEDFGCVLYTKQ
jgi:hypothetical protein